MFDNVHNTVSVTNKYQNDSMNKLKIILLALALLCFIKISAIDHENIPEIKAQQNPSEKERLAWWHEARFGMFITWGVYSMYGGVYNGHQQARGGAEWIMNRCKIPIAEYREKARQFNPVNYKNCWRYNHKSLPTTGSTLIFAETPKLPSSQSQIGLQWKEKTGKPV